MADLITFTLYDPDGRALDTTESNWDETVDDIRDLLRLSGIYRRTELRFDANLSHVAHAADQQLRDAFVGDVGVVQAELPDWYYITMQVQR